MKTIISDFFNNYGYYPNVFELHNAYSNGILSLTDSEENELLQYFEKNNYNIITFEEWCKKDNIQYSPKENSLLEEAKRRYPIGTEIYSAFDPSCKYKAIVYGHRISSDNEEIFCLGIRGEDDCHIYNKGRWAEIINSDDCDGLEKGKWYVCSSWSKGAIAKLDKIDKEFYFKEAYINTLISRPYINSWGYYKSNCRLATHKELCDYLPKNHPDNPSNIKEWNKDTYVVITGEYHSVEIGEVHKIDYEDTRETVNITTSVGTACMPYKSVVKWFATKEEYDLQENKSVSMFKQLPSFMQYPLTPKDVKGYFPEEAFGQTKDLSDIYGKLQESFKTTKKVETNPLFD